MGAGPRLVLSHFTQQKPVASLQAQVHVIAGNPRFSSRAVYLRSWHFLVQRSGRRGIEPEDEKTVHGPISTYAFLDSHLDCVLLFYFFYGIRQIDVTNKMDSEVGTVFV